MEAFIKEDMNLIDGGPGEFMQWLLPDDLPLPQTTEIEALINQKSFAHNLKILRNSNSENAMYKPLVELLNSITTLAHTHDCPSFCPTFIDHSGYTLLGRQKGLKPALVMVEGYLKEKFLRAHTDDEDKQLEKTTAQDRIDRYLYHDRMASDKTALSAVEVESSSVSWGQVLVAIEVKNFGPQSLRPSSRTTLNSQSMEPSSSGQQSTQSSRSSSKRHLEENECIRSASKRLKPEDVNARSSEVQLGSYFNAMQSDMGNRRHVIGCLFERDNFSIFFANACGVVCERFNISKSPQNKVNFVKIFIGLSTASLCKLGYDNHFHPRKPPAGQIAQPLETWHPNLEVPSALTASPKTCSYWLNGENCIIMEEAIDIQKGLHGRYTRVFGVEKGDVFRMQMCEDKLSIKIANKCHSRPSEMELVSHTHNILGEGAPNLFAEFTGVATSDGPRSILALVDNHPDAAMVQVITLMERLYPIQELSRYDYCLVFGEILSDINTLAKNKMLHRDISSGNLMYRKLREGKVRGILNDYDRAIIIEGSELAFNPLLQKPTGTLAFLALDLVQLAPGTSAPKHILRFDLESMLYVFIWDTATKGKEGIPKPLTAWLEHTTEKGNLSTQLLAGEIPLGRMEPLRPHLVDLALALEMGRVARNRAKAKSDRGYDDETLGGHFTYEIFAAIVEDMKSALRELGYPPHLVHLALGPDYISSRLERFIYVQPVDGHA